MPTSVRHAPNDGASERANNDEASYQIRERQAQRHGNIQDRDGLYNDAMSFPAGEGFTADCNFLMSAR